MSEEKIIDIMGKAFTEYQKAYRSNEDEVGVVYPRNEYKDVITYMVSKIWPQFEHLQAQLALLQWVKITPETMPKKGAEIIAKNIERPMRFGHWRDIEFQAEFDSLAKFFTHYVILPPLPDKEKSDA